MALRFLLPLLWLVGIADAKKPKQPSAPTFERFCETPTGTEKVASDEACLARSTPSYDPYVPESYDVLFYLPAGASPDDARYQYLQKAPLIEGSGYAPKYHELADPTTAVRVCEWPGGIAEGDSIEACFARHPDAVPHLVWNRLGIGMRPSEAVTLSPGDNPTADGKIRFGMDFYGNSLLLPRTGVTVQRFNNSAIFLGDGSPEAILRLLLLPGLKSTEASRTLHSDQPASE